VADDDAELLAAIAGLETAQAYFEDHKLSLDVTDALLELRARLAHRKLPSVEQSTRPPGEADEVVDEWSDVPTRKDRR